MDPLTLLIDLLAVFRLTRLVVKDSLLNGPRWWILRRWPSELTTFPDLIVTKDEEYPNRGWLTESGPHVFLTADGEWVAERTYKWTELVECAWCASIWLAVGVLMLEAWWDWWRWPALVLAFSAVTGLIFKRWDNE